MPHGRPLVPLALTHEQQDQLKGVAHSTTLPYALVLRARIILASAEGSTNAEVAKRLGVTPHTVGKWRRRFRAAGIEGLHDELRPGRPRSYDDDKVAAVINRALHESPDAATHWSTRTLGRAEGLSKSTVQRWFALFGVKPHLAKTFKLSTDPFFIEKVRDIVGLYLNPPDHAMVLCVDEKSQIQALNRTQPTLPMGLGYAEGYTHDYVRHGTTTLFAALDIATGQVFGHCWKRHRRGDSTESHPIAAPGQALNGIDQVGATSLILPCVARRIMTLSETLSQIQALVDRGEIRISLHGYDELAADQISVRDVVGGLKDAILIEDYPDYPKGPSCLVLQRDGAGQLIHVVWGIPAGRVSPAVVITAYRPDPAKWDESGKRRRT